MDLQAPSARYSIEVQYNGMPTYTRASLSPRWPVEAIERLPQCRCAGMTGTVMFGIVPNVNNDLASSMSRAASLVHGAKARGMRGAIHEL